MTDKKDTNSKEILDMTNPFHDENGMKTALITAKAIASVYQEADPDTEITWQGVLDHIIETHGPGMEWAKYERDILDGKNPEKPSLPEKPVLSLRGPGQPPESGAVGLDDFIMGIGKLAQMAATGMAGVEAAKNVAAQLNEMKDKLIGVREDAKRLFSGGGRGRGGRRPIPPRNRTNSTGGPPVSPGGSVPRERDFSWNAITANQPPFETSFKPEVSSFSRGEVRIDAVSVGAGVYGTTRQSSGSVDVWSGCQLQGLRLEFPSDNQNESYQFFKTVTLPSMKIKAQQALKYSVQTDAAYWSDANVLKYFNHTWLLCQIYYFVDSIISYVAEDMNLNLGMRNLFQNLSVGNIRSIAEARVFITTRAIPTGLHSSAFEFFANQKENAFANSPMTKFVPVEITLDEGTSGEPNFVGMFNKLRDILDDLTTDPDLLKLGDVLNDVYPHWMSGRAYSSTSEPRFNLDYGNAWSCAPYLTTDTNGDTYSYPTMRTTTDTLFVQTKTESDRNDGAMALALGVTVGGTRYLGWAKPVKLSSQTSRIYWSGQNSLWKCVTHQGNAFGVGDGYQIFDCSYWGATTDENDNILKPLPRMDTLRNISIRAFTEVEQQLVQLMFDLNSIGRIKDNREYTNNATAGYPLNDVPDPNKSKQSRGRRKRRKR